MTPRKRLLFVVGLAVALAVAALVVALRRPGPTAAGPADPLELLPDRCQAVFVVPDPGRLGEHLGVLPRLKLADLVASLANYPSAEAFLADLAAQAGFDPRSRESMRQGGIDPSRPLVAYLSEKVVPLALIPVADQAKFEERFTRGAAARLGPQKPQATALGGGRTLFTITGQGPDPQVVAWAYASGYALITGSRPGVELLKSALAQAPTGSLARDERFRAARARLADRDLFAFSCLDAVPLQKQAFIPYGTTFAASLSERELSLSAELPLDDAWAETLKSLSTPAGGELLGTLDPDAFLLARLGGDPALLEPLVDRLLPAGLRRALSEAGIDVASDILKNLKPGVAGALSLASSARLSAVPELDVRKTNPFDYVRLTAVGSPVDPARAEKTLASVAGFAPRFGARMEPEQVSGTRVYVTRYHLGEGASLALFGDRFLVTGGAGQMAAALERASSAAKPALADPAAARSLAEDATALYVDVARLGAGVRRLPDSAYGIGGWAIKAAVARWLDAVEEIPGLRASTRLAGKTLSAELALTLKPAPASAQKDARAP